MRGYVMGFNQSEACKLELSLEELLIVRWFSDFYASPKAAKLRVGNVDYLLIVKSKLMNDLPILGVGDRTISRHMEALISAKVLIRHMETTDRGTRVYYAAGESYALLIGDTEPKTIEKRNEKAGEPDNAPQLIVYVENGIGRITPGNWHDLNEFMSDGITEDMVRFAVDECVAQKAPSFAYLRTMLNGWIVDGLTTMDAIRTHEQERRESKARTARMRDKPRGMPELNRMEDFI